MDKIIFFLIFVDNKNETMENNNQNINTGQKGVFPGSQSPNQSKHSQIVESNIVSTQNVTVKPNTNINYGVLSETNTYIMLETKNPDGQVSGIIEIDLISFREKGQESRYVSIKTSSAGQDGVQNDTIISIDNEQDFKRFKDFISNLNWND